MTAPTSGIEAAAGRTIGRALTKALAPAVRKLRMTRRLALDDSIDDATRGRRLRELFQPEIDR